MSAPRSRRLVDRVGRRLRGRLPGYPAAAVQAGPGAGLRIGYRRASADYSLGTNEAAVQAVLGDTLRPGDVFLDVGAAVADLLRRAAYRVEPLPDAYAHTAWQVRHLRALPRSTGDPA